VLVVARVLALGGWSTVGSGVMDENKVRPSSFSEALLSFETMERELGLSTWCIDGIMVWKLLRFEVFGSYLEAHGLKDVGHPDSKLKHSKLKILARVVSRLVFRNPFLDRPKNVTRIVMTVSRKRMHKGRFADQVSLRAWAGSLEANSLVLDATSPSKPHQLKNKPNGEVLLAFGWLLGRLRKFPLSEGDLLKIREVQKVLSEDLKISGHSLEKYLPRRVQSFYGGTKAYRALFRLTRPKAIYLVCSHDHEAAISAAQALGIETVEFQHGIMGRGHLGYDFKNWNDVPYFPDHIMAWGKDWFNTTSFPSRCRIHLVGAPHIVEAINEARIRVPRQPKTLLVLSQGDVRKKLLASVIEFANLRPDWTVKIRPHPSETSVDFMEEIQVIEPNNSIFIEVDSLRSLAEATSEAAVVFGSSSTSIFEAIEAGCRAVILWDSGLSSFIDHMIQRGEVQKVLSGRDLADKIDNLPLSSRGKYFAPAIYDVVNLVED